MDARVDAVVIGAGVIGSSIAERLLERAPTWRVVLLEKEQAPGTGETRYATGGVRHQFGTEANIALSLISTPIFERFPNTYGIDPHFRKHGYLFVTGDPKRLEIMDRELALQTELGVMTERLDRAGMKRVCPPLFTDDLLGGNYCPMDGSIEPAAVLQAYIDTLRKRGGAMATEAEVISIEREDAVWAVSTSRVTYHTPVVVIASGARTRMVAALAGLDVPAHAFARQVFVAEKIAEIPDGMPLTIDMDTGWYVRATESSILLGGTDRDARPVEESTAEVDWDGFTAIHEAGSHRMPALTDAHVVRAYSSVRAVTPDDHPILGPVDSHPGLFLAAGLSGHEIMHSPAVGILLSEWIVDGRPTTWDARPLMLDRFEKRRFLNETSVF